jgi:xeroderma pigmentosum group C-complementing protein
MQNLYGEWQVEKFKPPKCENGKIPLNDFGNVDMFKAEMIPEGCVHVDLPGANKIATSIGIEHANACTGFSFHGGRAVPDINGIIILEMDESKFRDVFNSINRSKIRHMTQKLQFSKRKNGEDTKVKC